MLTLIEVAALHTHTAPADTGADWYTGNLHKWCYTLKGVALLYTAPSRQDETQSLVISHYWKGPYLDRFWMQAGWLVTSKLTRPPTPPPSAGH